MKEDFELSKVTESDYTAMYNLILNNGGNKNLTEDKLQHWYSDNPSKSNSLWKVVVEDAIEGFATTNNFRYIIENRECLVAMPQNVITSLKIRGKGLFNKLYFKTELDNIENNNVAYFLTFTNKLSTPIFLKKFGYLKGKCPSLLITLFNPLNLFFKKKYKSVENLNSIDYFQFYHFNNSMLKSKEYFQWRYYKYTEKKLRIITVLENKKEIGHAILLVEKKKGIKFLVLSDIICYTPENIPLIINACHAYTAKNYFPFMIMFDIDHKINKGIFTLTIKERFNFLVKGKTVEETEMLSLINFNYFFGDMDIV